MFTPPAEPVVIRGSAWGPLSAYWLAAVAWAVVLWGVGRSSAIGALVVLVLGLALFGAMAFAAAGTRVEAGSDEIVVVRRWRPTWRVPVRDFRFIVENVPARPRMRSLAGWTFRTVDPEERQKLEIAMFAPAERRALRRLFREVIVDADAGMRRR